MSDILFHFLAAECYFCIQHKPTTHITMMNLDLFISLFINRIGGPQFLIILVIILLLFGGKKIPELMHGIGKGVRSFKKGLADIEEDVKDIEKEDTKTTK